MISYQPLDVHPVVKQGDSYKFNVQVLDASTRQPKNLEDVTEGYYTFRSSNKSGTELITKTLNDNIVILNPIEGIVEITITSDDTKALPVGMNYHESKLKTALGSQFTVLDEYVHVEEQAIKEII